MSEQSLEGQVTVVTGASGGIGAALCHHLAAAGARVYGLGRSEERLAAALSGTTATARTADLLDQRAVEATMADIARQAGPIDILYNNAGRFHCIAGVHEADVEDWWEDVTVNVKGTMMACRAVLPAMLERDSGTIVNMSGGRPIGGSAYSASKAAVDQFTTILAGEVKHLGKTGIRVLLANPGLVQTEMTEYQRDTEAGKFWIPGVGRMLDQGRTRRPDEIAQMSVQMLANAQVSDNGREFNPDGWVK